MPREMGRNAHKAFLGSVQTMQMCELAVQTIDDEIRRSSTGLLENLKDVVYDALFINLPWWKAEWVDFPGFCQYNDKTHGAWVCIINHWSKTHKGQALRPYLDERLARPGVDSGVWYVIASWDEALPIVKLTLDDNSSRLANNMEQFDRLATGSGNRAVLVAIRSAPAFGEMQYNLIEAATWFSDLIATAPPGWGREDDAITAVERRCGFSNTAVREVGRELWAAHP